MPGSRAGLYSGLGAYVIWGFIPLYFKSVDHVPSSVVLCHRIIWSGVVIALIVTARREWKPIWQAVQSPRNMLYLSAGAILIATNWLTFIYAVATRQLLQASLGYFINPLLSIALGMIFLRERLRPFQWAAVVMAILAVLHLAWNAAGLPWIALALAGSFGFYGLVRKKIDINSLHGLLIESVVLLPVASVGLLLIPSVAVSPATFTLLSLSGIITAVPLLLFGAAVRRLKLSTMGFLQYVGPTLQFTVAVLLFREPLDPVKLSSFAICWLAIAIYAADSIWRHQPQPVADEPD
jgi:chloramphenicol-sensitive protein RarD